MLSDDYFDGVGDSQYDEQHEGLIESSLRQDAVDFEDPKISRLPRVVLMGPRRGGKTSIQVRTVTSCFCF